MQLSHRVGLVSTELMYPYSQSYASLSARISADLLEASQAHAVHRFVIEDQEGGESRLLVCLILFARFDLPNNDPSTKQIWIFNPFVRVAYSTALQMPESTPLDATSQSVHAMSVFYHALDHDDNAARCVCCPCITPFPPPNSALPGHSLATQTFLSKGPVEHFQYPLAICHRVVQLLQASTMLQPASCRSVSSLQVGLLERL